MARLASFAFVLLWSSSFVSTRAGLNFVSPLTCVTLRLGLCALVQCFNPILTALIGGPLLGEWSERGSGSASSSAPPASALSSAWQR